MVKHTRRPGLGGLMTLVVAAGAISCSRPDEGLTQQLLAANDKVLACQKELAQTKDQIGGLKRQLAQAIANPSRIQLKDPEIIELVASLRGPAPAGNQDVQPSLDPHKASEIVMNGAHAMQSCYERALKKNAALQTQSGIGFTLGITVKPTGLVEGVDVAPSFDRGMTECIRSVATHWKFPTFQGKAVTIEQRVTLTPKT
jgi:hypothetical protein